MDDFIARQNAERLRRRVSAELKVRPQSSYDTIARSLFEMGLLCGAFVRLYRAIVLTNVPATSGMLLPVATGFGLFVALVFATLHLSRFQLKEWRWRAPAFAAVVAASEMLVSLMLIWLEREPLGSGGATFRDWPGMLVYTFLTRITIISAFALVLGALYYWTRDRALRRDHGAWRPGEHPFVERRRPPAQYPFVDRRRRNL